MEFTPAQLNLALSKALDWGPERAMPLADRLAAGVPELSPSDRARLAAYIEPLCGRLTFSLANELQGLAASGPADQSQINAAWRTCRERMTTEHPWLNSDNLQRIGSQAQYYAWHDGYM